MIDGQGHRRPAVKRANLIVTQRAQFDLGDVAHAYQPAGGVCFQHHVGKLVGVGESPKRANRVLKHLPARDWRPTDLSGRHLHVLLFHCPRDVRSRDATDRHLLRVQPQPH